MKKIVIDRTIYVVKNKDFEELESLVISMQNSPVDEELEYYRKYLEYCEYIKSKYGDGKTIDGVYSTDE